jgi:hypothetical protein
MNHDAIAHYFQPVIVVCGPKTNLKDCRVANALNYDSLMLTSFCLLSHLITPNPQSMIPTAEAN